MRAILHGEKRVLKGVVREKQAPKTQRLAKTCHGESHEACIALRGMQPLTYLALRCGKVDIGTLLRLRTRASCRHAILGPQGGGPWRASNYGHAMVRRCVRPSSWANSSTWRPPVKS